MKIYSDISDEEIEQYYKLISENVKRIRISKELTQEQVSLSMGFTTATFYTNAESMKRGKHFNLEHLIKLSKILDVPMESFFKSMGE